MDLLLDTHAFIWFDLSPEKLSERVIEALRDEDNRLYLSVASVWEMQIKIQLGKLRLEAGLTETLTRQQRVNQLYLLDIKTDHIEQLSHLQDHHRDPFDRLLIAQAMKQGYSLVTKDAHIHAYQEQVELLW